MQSVFDKNGYIQKVASSIVAGSLVSRTVITATGTSTYTPPAGVKILLVECIGSGGSGGNTLNSSAGQIIAAPGGAGGGYDYAVIPANCSRTYTVIVPAATLAGNNGSACQFNTPGKCNIGNATINLVSASGGGTGDLGIKMTTGATEAFSRGGAGGAGVTAGQLVSQLNWPGENGHRASGTIAYSGAGGSSRYGAGGQGRITHGNGNPGLAYGGAGGGGLSINAGGATNGGTGGQGICIIWEFA